MERAAPIRRAPAPAGRPAGSARALTKAGALGIGAAVALAVVALQMLGAFAAVEAAALEVMSRFRGSGEPDSTVLVCGIDGGVDRVGGPSSWTRADLASLVERLARGGARVIVLDLDLALPTPPSPEVDRAWEDEALAAAIADAGNVVLTLPGQMAASAEPGPAPETGPAPAPRIGPVLEIESSAGSRFSVPRWSGAKPNLDLFRAAAEAEGFAPVAAAGGRRLPLLASDGHLVLPRLALAAASAYEGQPARLSAPGRGEGKRARRPRLRLSGEPVPVDAQGRLTLDFHRPPSWAAAADVLAGRVGAERLNDRLVFVGLLEEAMARSTPFDPRGSHLLLEAAAAGNLLARSAVRAGGVVAAVGWLATLAWGLLAAGIASLSKPRQRRTSPAAAAVAGLVLLWPVASYAALATSSWHLPLASPLLAATGAALAVLGVTGSRRRRRRRELESLLSGTVPAAAVEALALNPEAALATERRRATVLAVEISGLAELADRLAPEAFEAALQRALAPLSAAVLGAGGSLESAGADALKAVFGAPLPLAEPAGRACRAAVALRAETPKLKAVLAAAREVPLGSLQPALEIGIASGEMTVGVLAPHGRPLYSAVGAAASLAPRLARLGRIYGTQVVLDEATASLAGDQVVLRELDRVRLRGQAAPATIYELMAPSPASPSDRQRVVRYEAALAAFRNREFVRAERLFSSILEDLGEDPPARHFAERCRRLRATPPPEGWDGTAAYPHF